MKRSDVLWRFACGDVFCIITKQSSEIENTAEEIDLFTQCEKIFQIMIWNWKEGEVIKWGLTLIPYWRRGRERELLHYSSSSKDLMLSQMDLSTSRKSVFSSQCHTLETVLGCSFMPKMTFARPGDVMKILIQQCWRFLHNFFECMARKWAPPEQNGRDISATSVAFCNSATTYLAEMLYEQRQMRYR